MVFITAFDHCAARAFDEAAVDYLVKPLDPARLARAMQRVRERLGQAPADMGSLLDNLGPADNAGPLRWITVQRGQELHLITADEVCYFQADHEYAAVVTADSSSLISMPLKELAARLDGAQFWQVHRSTIVNLRAIRAVSRGLAGRLVISLKNRPDTLLVSSANAHLFKQL